VIGLYGVENQTAQSVQAALQALRLGNLGPQDVIASLHSQERWIASSLRSSQ
jgi:hypothetical protein